MLEEELVLEDDEEGALELLVVGLPRVEELQHRVQDVGVGVGELLEGPGQRGLGRHAHLYNQNKISRNSRVYRISGKSSNHYKPCYSDLWRV